MKSTLLDDNGAPAVDRENLKEFLWWMCERQRIWQRRFQRREEPPWTEDPVLQDYHFCNVYRELDRGTQYYLEEISTAGSEEDIVFNTILYRFFNRPSTYRRLGGFTPVDEFDVDTAVHNLKVLDESVFSSAYRVTTHKWAESDSKIENILYGIIRDDLLENWDTYVDSILNADSLVVAFTTVTDIRGIGDFLGYEIVTDLNYDLLSFSENDFVNVGPGAEGGLEKIFDDTSKEHIYWVQEKQEELFDLFDLDFPYWSEKPELTLRDFEHSMCEWRKWWCATYIPDNPPRRYFEPKDYAQDKLSDFG